MRVSLALILIAASCTNKPGPDAGTVRVAGKAYPLVVVTTVDGRKSLAKQNRSERAILVYQGHARYQHYELPGSFDLLLLDEDDQVAEIIQQRQTEEIGVTSSVETRRALFLPLDSGAKKGDRVELPAIKAAGEPEAVVKLGSHGVNVELSRTLDERQHGLMYRPRMSKDDGMLFIYEYPDYRRFWMGNTLIDLDIAFFREDKTLINVVEMKKYPNPAVDPGDRAASNEPAKYVLEVNYGWFRAHGLIDANGDPIRKLTLEQVP